MLVGGLVAAGCTSSQSAEPLPTGGLGSDLGVADAEEVDTIVMIGDSITVVAKPALEAEFAAMEAALARLQGQSNALLSLVANTTLAQSLSSR